MAPFRTSTFFPVKRKYELWTIIFSEVSLVRRKVVYVTADYRLCEKVLNVHDFLSLIKESDNTCV